uniref:Uncharacterized protein n=1 Tax=uncultured Desulfobacterium sp. TaxID=201089 RepID=E1YAT0_9BACT|nr:unknown protein [uncultured Desulfobacterium sp.]
MLAASRQIASNPAKYSGIVDPMSRLIFIKIKLPKVSDIFSGFKFFFLTKSFSKGPLLPDK